MMSRSSRSPIARPLPRARRGFTIVELIVAIIIISVGLLALASGSGATLRQMELSQQQTNAALIAQSRLEQLRATATCAGFATGSTTVAPMYTDSWRVSTYTSMSRAIAETVSYTNRYGKTKKFGLEAVMPCQ